MVDPVLEAAEALADQGALEQGDVDNLGAKLASGPGWPKHHHHLHFSWHWEEHNAM